MRLLVGCEIALRRDEQDGASISPGQKPKWSHQNRFAPLCRSLTKAKLCDGRLEWRVAVVANEHTWIFGSNRRIEEPVYWPRGFLDIHDNGSRRSQLQRSRH